MKTTKNPIITEPQFGRCPTGEPHDFRFLRSISLVNSGSSDVVVREEMCDFFYCTRCLCVQRTDARKWRKVNP